MTNALYGIIKFTNTINEKQIYILLAEVPDVARAMHKAYYGVPRFKTVVLIAFGYAWE